MPGCYGKAGFKHCGVIWFRYHWVLTVGCFRVVGITKKVEIKYKEKTICMN
jgi:hypothetical protein